MGDDASNIVRFYHVPLNAYSLDEGEVVDVPILEPNDKAHGEACAVSRRSREALCYVLIRHHMAHRVLQC